MRKKEGMDNIQIRDLMRLSSNFVNENNTLFEALELIKKTGLNSILVVKEDFSILGNIDKDSILKIVKQELNNNIAEIKKIKLSELKIEYSLPVVLYPKMEVNETFSIMSHFSKKFLPVVNSPWDKKIIGFIHLKELKSAIEGNIVKITG